MRQRHVTLGERLRTLREKAGLTQVQLAEATGIARSRIAEYESDRHDNPTVEMLRRLAKGLRVDKMELLRGTK